MLYREWNIREADAQKAEAIEQSLSTGRLLADVLVAREIDTPEAAAVLLGDSGPLPSPFTLKDMDKAVQRIHEAIEAEEPMVIFGDYDVDGITSTALLYSYLEEAGANVFYKLPSRTDDGYGLTPDVVDQIASHGISLIVTVDNGTSAHEAVERATELGVEVVMTDHHLPQETLPAVVALINPHRADDESAYKMLSGVGVAFMLVAALEDASPEEMLPLFGDFVAIGTVADVMKLEGPNRTLVRAGLSALRETDRPGIVALTEACGWQDKAITVENISYGLAPRLNAAGRMDDATTALRLLLAETPEEAAELVEILQQQNLERQETEHAIVDELAAQIEASPELQRSRVLVVWGEGWHQGVIGIVASRLVERYAKPTIVISLEDGEGRGSGRSFAGFSLFGAVSSCADILIRYGGHNLAAGLSIEPQHLEEFRRRVNEWAAENTPVFSLPELVADAQVNLASLTLQEVQKLDMLSPCGSGNPAPHFLLREAVVDAVFAVSEGKHSRLRLRQGNETIYAVMFGTGPAQLPYKQGDTVDVLLALSVYEGKGGEQISARVLDLRPAGLDNAHVRQSALYEGFVSGVRLQESLLEELCPSREDTAEVYRVVRAGDVKGEDLRAVFAKLPQVPAGRVLSSLAALQELGLITKNEETQQYTVVRVQEKRDLATSELLQKLGFAQR